MRAISPPTSCVLVDTGSPPTASGDVRRLSEAVALAVVVPVPRDLGRCHFGVRRMWCTPAAVSKTSSTNGSTPGGAWWLRRRSMLAPSPASPP